MKKRATVKISKFIILIVVLLFVAIIAKLSYVVLSNKVDGINLQEKAASIATVKKTLYADRGSIYDVNGDELASTINSYTVIAYINSNKTNVTDKEMTAEALSPILNMSKENQLLYFNLALDSNTSDVVEYPEKVLNRLGLNDDNISIYVRYYDVETGFTSWKKLKFEP